MSCIHTLKKITVIIIKGRVTLYAPLQKLMPTNSRKEFSPTYKKNKSCHIWTKETINDIGDSRYLKRTSTNGCFLRKTKRKSESGLYLRVIEFTNTRKTYVVFFQYLFCILADVIHF